MPLLGPLLTPASRVTVRGSSFVVVFVQRTIVPFLIVTVAGEKAESPMFTDTSELCEEADDREELLIELTLELVLDEEEAALLTELVLATELELSELRDDESELAEDCELEDMDEELLRELAEEALELKLPCELELLFPLMTARIQAWRALLSTRIPTRLRTYFCTQS